jgi:hypothetical protein
MFIANNYVRGAVTGLGLVNLYAGFADLVPVVLGARRRRKMPASGEVEP